MHEALYVLPKASQRGAEGETIEMNSGQLRGYPFMRG